MAELVAKVWGDSADAAEVELGEFTAEYLRALDEPRVRPTIQPITPAPPSRPEPVPILATEREPVVGGTLIEPAVETAKLVERDRAQRAVAADVSDPADLEALRLELRELLPHHAPHVRVWTWRAATSGGRAITPLGADSGYELRLSYYR